MFSWVQADLHKLRCVRDCNRHNMKIYLINVEEDDVLKSLQHTQVAICITFKVAHLQILNKMSSRGGIKKKSVIYLSVSLII